LGSPVQRYGTTSFVSDIIGDHEGDFDTPGTSTPFCILIRIDFFGFIFYFCIPGLNANDISGKSNE
jgi:hypothetical protein